jgi:hypothetical protein
MGNRNVWIEGDRLQKIAKYFDPKAIGVQVGKDGSGLFRLCSSQAAAMPIPDMLSSQHFTSTSA